MPIEVALELDWRGKRYRDIQRGLNAINMDLKVDIEQIGPIVRKNLKLYMEGVVKSVRQRTTTPYPGGTSPAGAFPGTLSKRSGALSASLNPSHIKVGNQSSQIEVAYTLSGIAAVHEKGATITPKRAQYLTIPLPPALTSRGVPKKQSARDWKNTFVLKSKKGNLLIVQKQGRGELLPLYVLKKQVTIPKRLAFEEAFTGGKDFLADKIAEAVVREFFK